MQIYIIVAIIVLAVIALVFFFMRKNKIREKVTLLTGLAFGFILGGILFSDDRRFSYSFFGIAIILAVIDIIVKFKKNRKK